MNILYLTQLTNLEISDKNPLKYIKEYDVPKVGGEEQSKFEKVLESHLLSDDLLKWSRMDIMPDNALDIFIEKRVSTIIEGLKMKLAGIEFGEIDTKGTEKAEEETLEETEESPIP